MQMFFENSQPFQKSQRERLFDFIFQKSQNKIILLDKYYSLLFESRTISELNSIIKTSIFSVLPSCNQIFCDLYGQKLSKEILNASSERHRFYGLRLRRAISSERLFRVQFLVVANEMMTDKVNEKCKLLYMIIFFFNLV